MQSDINHYYSNLFPIPLFWTFCNPPSFRRRVDDKQTMSICDSAHSGRETKTSNDMHVEHEDEDKDNPTKTFREFSWSFENGPFYRYQFFTSLDDFSKMIWKTNLPRLDIGPVYKASSRRDEDRIGKEIVIDVDLSEFNDTRTCCSEKTMCQECWIWFQVGVRCLHHIIQYQYAFQNVLWVFSGRRGFHIWICDPKVLFYKKTMTSAIANHLRLVHSRIKDKKYITRNLDDDTCRQALNIILPYMEHISDQVLEKTCALLEPRLLQKITQIGDKDARRSWKSFTATNSREMVQTVALICLFPRIDYNVTAMETHLIKAPLSVHPSTGQVCIPFNPETIQKATYDDFIVPVSALRIQHPESLLKFETSKRIMENFIHK